MTQMRTLSDAFNFRVSLAVEEELQACLATYNGANTSARLRAFVESPEVQKIIRRRAAALALRDALAARPPVPPAGSTATESSSPPPPLG